MLENVLIVGCLVLLFAGVILFFCWQSAERGLREIRSIAEGLESSRNDYFVKCGVAVKERDEALAERDLGRDGRSSAIARIDSLEKELSETRSERGYAIAEKYRFRAERDEARNAGGTLRRQRDEAIAERDALREERDAAVEDREPIEYALQSIESNIREIRSAVSPAPAGKT